MPDPADGSQRADGGRHGDGGRHADDSRDAHDGRHAGAVPVSAGMPAVAKHQDSGREFFCRCCDKRVAGNVPAGWYRLNRRIVPGSLGSTWRWRSEMPMGLYCSIACFQPPRACPWCRESVQCPANRLGE
jgi:hypothetical protein